jgi:hypothetical protein
MATRSTSNDNRTEPITAITAGEGEVPDDLTAVGIVNARREAAGMVPLFGPASPVDLEAFARAQTDFIQAQIAFYSPRMPGDQAFLEVLTAYSRAQTELIKAQYRFMHQVGLV